MIRVLLVDDEAAIRKGLRMQLELEPDLLVVGEAANGRDAIGLIHELCPDIVVMDVHMAVMDGIAATAALRTCDLPVSVIVLSMFDDAATRLRAADAGARAFVGKHEPPESLVLAIRRVVQAAA